MSEHGNDCPHCARLKARTMRTEDWRMIHAGLGHTVASYEDRGPGYLIAGLRCSCGAKHTTKAGPNPDEREED